MIEKVASEQSAVKASGRKGSVLATSQQQLLEQRALELVSRPEMAVAKAEIATLFNADRNALFANQQEFIARSIDEQCFHAALMAANETPRNPYFVWSITLAHQWLGIAVPGSRMGQDNPDNIYRFAVVDPAMAYTITGRFAAQPPTDFSLCSLPAHVGEGIAADVRGFVTRDNLDVDAEGRFEILVDGSATDGRRNHLSINDAKVLMIRDTLADWSVERAVEVTVQRLDDHTADSNSKGEPVDEFDSEQSASRAAYLASTIAEFFLNKVQHGMCEVAPLNTVPPPMASAGRGGLVTQTASLGYYRLGVGEVMLMTIDPLGARYLGVQLCDMWMLSYDYSQHTSCLNNRQAVADSDGLIRMVISAEDPGVHNWLDGCGYSLGTILLRWHSIPAGADFSNAITTEVLAIDELPARLHKETLYLDSSARQQQREHRYRDYRHRIDA